MQKDPQEEAQEMLDEVKASFLHSRNAVVLALIAVLLFTALALGLTFREVTWIGEWPYAQGLEFEFFLGIAGIIWLIAYLVKRLIRIWDY